MRRSEKIMALLIVFILVIISTFTVMSGMMSRPPATDEGLTSPVSTAHVNIICTSGNYCTFDAEIADCPEERATGLMNRTFMAADCGMLFIFEDSVVHSFWMKNTRIPLDMIFIDHEGKIVDIHQNAVPLSLDIIQPAKPCKYVLELNGGICANKSICIGDRVIIE